MLETTDYKNLRQQSLQSGSICHGEYNQHNVLILGKNTAVTNFSHWSFDVQMADLYRFMRKILEKYSWDLHLAQKMLSAYDSVRPLSESGVAEPESPVLLSENTGNWQTIIIYITRL